MPTRSGLNSPTLAQQLVDAVSQVHVEHIVLDAVLVEVLRKVPEPDVRPEPLPLAVGRGVDQQHS